MTHWSTRRMAEAAGLSEKSVRRICDKHGLKPHLSRTFKVSKRSRVCRETGSHRWALSQLTGTPSCFAPMKRVRSKYWTAPSLGFR